MLKREIPSINFKQFVNKLVCFIRIFYFKMHPVWCASVLILYTIILSGCGKQVSCGIFPSSFYFRTDLGLEENSVTDAEVDTAEPVATISEEEFTALRIEYIKNQILRKLRLKEKPQITIGDLPKPVMEYENFIPDQDMTMVGKYNDDFYGKTTQAIVLPYEDEAKCFRKVHYPSACLPFQMPNDIHSSDVSTAELWFHKKADIMDKHNQTFIISEVAHWDKNKSFQKTNPVAIQDTSITDGWLKVDVTYVVKKWMDYQESPIHALNVLCKTCGLDKSLSPISFSGDMKPFLIIYTHSQKRRSFMHRRQKRSSECRDSPNECCRESLYVSFAEIGWSNWIIKPEGYNAYFCRGSCTTPTAVMNSASHHNSILQKVMGKNNQRGSRPELTPCCAATQYQPLQLVYMDGNKTLTTKLLSNMIVETCGCM
ncbi:growth/differentiation factor 8 [Anthonomus grandis grandis]|uniref:growth/differentiation factor 8 n=1 Tax=Anthonomus grandis grandis TaxID=2921223 RepID=UPI0021667E40|nr:growth/differentiation factor 8 [Anthonomus grandis grandis]